MITEFSVAEFVFGINKNRNHCFFFEDLFFELIKTVMEINLLRSNLCTITDIVFFGRRRRRNHLGRETLFFSQRNGPFQLRLCS